MWQMPCGRTGYQQVIVVARSRGKELACVKNLDSDLVCARGLHLDILNLERFACTPAYSSLAFDDLACSLGHGSDVHGGVGILDAVISTARAAIVVGLSASTLDVISEHLLQARKCHTRAGEIFHAN